MEWYNEDPADWWKHDDRRRNNPQAEAWVRYYERYFDRLEELKIDQKYRELYKGFKAAERAGDYVKALDFASSIWYAWKGFTGEDIDKGGT